MKLLVSTCALLFVTLEAGLAFSGEPIITESEDKIVVEYTGSPQEPKKEKEEPVSSIVAKKLEELRKLQEEGRALQEQLKTKYLRESPPALPVRQKSDDIGVCCISAMETERSSNYVTYSVKADVDNKGESGEVFIKLVAKNRDGHQIDYVYLHGVLDRRESRTLTTTTMMTFQQAMDARVWEVVSASKY